MSDIKVISRKFYNQLRNGDDFTLNTGDYTDFLLGNATGKYKAVFELGVKWFSLAEQVGATATNPFIFSAADNSVTRAFGSWIDDGFKLGDTVAFKTTSATNDVTRTITEITDLYIVVDGAALTNQTDGYAIAVGETTLSDVQFKYGLIGNDESVNYLSKIDGNIQSYSLTGVTGSFTAMSAVGLQKSWQNGQCEIKTGSGVALNLANGAVSYSGTTQTFIIEHEFVLIPYCLDGQQSNVDNVDPTDIWESDKCLRYVFSIDAASDINNPNSIHSGDDSLLLGNTGWLNEQYNGGISNYSLTSVAYTDKVTGSVVDGVQVNRATTVTAVIAGVNISSSTRYALTHSFLPLEDDYKGATAQDSTFEQNFLYENFVGLLDAAPSSGDIIENVDADVDSTTQCTITFDINYSASNQEKLSTDDNYLLSVLIQDSTVVNKDQVSLKTGSGTYSKGEFGDDTSGLITINDDLSLYQRISDTGVAGNTQIEAYIEDKILSRFTFELDYSDSTKQPKINKISPKLVGYNGVTSGSFIIQREDIDTSIYPIAYNSSLAGEVQTISVNDTRNFKLVSGSDFNKSTVLILDGTSTSIEHTMNWAFAFNWEDYKKLVEANSSFFNASELNNGLNHKSSNYSQADGLTDWGVYLFYDFDVENTVDGTVTSYRQISPELKVFDYDTYSGSNPWTVTKKFTNQSGTDTSLTILNTENTKVWFEFVNSLGDVGSDYEGEIKLEEYRNGGLEPIAELSTTELPASNNPLIPLSGDTYARITKSPSNTLTLECQIDKSLISSGKQYHVSGRIFTGIPDLFLFEDGEGILLEDGTPLITE